MPEPRLLEFSRWAMTGTQERNEFKRELETKLTTHRKQSDGVTEKKEPESAKISVLRDWRGRWCCCPTKKLQHRKMNHCTLLKIVISSKVTFNWSLTLLIFLFNTVWNHPLATQEPVQETDSALNGRFEVCQLSFTLKNLSGNSLYLSKDVRYPTQETLWK